MDSELRSKLDTASLMPRGRWRSLWEAAATEFAAPAREWVDRLIEERSDEGASLAAAWLLNPEGPPPVLPRHAWMFSLEQWKDIDWTELKRRAKAVVNAIEACADPERVLPLLLAGIGARNVGYPLARAKWLEAHPLGCAAAVACLSTQLRNDAFRALSYVRGLAIEARGAMWLVTWSDPSRVEYDYPAYARLGEPAAIAASLHDSLLLGVESLPLRPALARALCRIIRREDPWIEPQWSKEDYEGKPMGPPVLQGALRLLPRVARSTGSEAIARETLDSCWQSLGVEGAVARGLLGGVDAMPALVAALDGETEQRALTALAAIGPGARESLEAIRGRPESMERTVALASVDGSAATLDALIPLCQQVIEYAPEILMQYEEGLITSEEYARKFDPAVESVRMWAAVESSPEREAMRERLRVLVDEHPAIHGDAAIERLRAAIVQQQP